MSNFTSINGNNLYFGMRNSIWRDKKVKSKLNMKTKNEGHSRGIKPFGSPLIVIT